MTDPRDRTADSDDGGLTWGRVTAALGGVLSASALGISLTESPSGFVKAVIIDWALGGIVDLFGTFGSIIVWLWDLLLENTVGILASAIPGATLADIPLELLELLARTFRDIAAGLGPFSIILIVLLWAATVVLLLVGIYGLMKLIKFLMVVSPYP